MLYTAIKAFFAAIFGSLWGRLFPAKTADAQRAEDLSNVVKIQAAESQAATSAPDSKTKLEALLEEHRL